MKGHALKTAEGRHTWPVYKDVERTQRCLYSLKEDVSQQIPQMMSWSLLQGQGVASSKSPRVK